MKHNGASPEEPESREAATYAVDDPHADCENWCDGEHDFPATAEEQEFADFIGLQNFTRRGYQIAKHTIW